MGLILNLPSGLPLFFCVILLGNFPNLDIALDHLSRIQLYCVTPPRAPRDMLYVVPMLIQMLIGACNPMERPILASLLTWA